MNVEQELIELRELAQALARRLDTLTGLAEPWRIDALRITRGEALALADDLDQLVRPPSLRGHGGPCAPPQSVPSSR